MLSIDKPDRMTFFAQISSEDGQLTQSVICDMYTRADLQESPTQLNEEIVFHSVDQAILGQD